MFKRIKLSLTVLCSTLVLFTSVAISLDHLSKEVITGDELQQMSELRTKMIQANALESQNSLKKVPQVVEMENIKPFQQTSSYKNKIMGKLELQNNINHTDTEFFLLIHYTKTQPLCLYQLLIP